jgi:hypothetical protein
MMKQKILIFSLSINSLILHAQQKVNLETNKWSHKDRTEFVNTCVEAAKEGMSEDSASGYCYCMLAKIEKKFPDLNAMSQIDAELMATPEWQKIINNCLSGKEDAEIKSGVASDGLILTNKEYIKTVKYYGLIIGVSDYDDVRLDIDNPVLDATAFKDILTEKYLFDTSTTRLLLNPTRQAVFGELYRLRKVIGPDDNLLIFYAGHGFWDNDVKQGYWWAKDAHPGDPSSWLSNSDLREQIRGIKSAHTLLISDACFSGGIFRSRSGDELAGASKDIQLLYKMTSRRAMTSGTMTKVPDYSPFLQYLIKRLSDNSAPFLSSQQLFDSIRTAAINNSSAVPQDGVIAETGDEGGDFIFILKKR